MMTAEKSKFEKHFSRRENPGKIAGFSYFET
jgi:hypothetical protein